MNSPAIAIVILLSASSFCLGQLPRTTLNTLYPPGGQQGSEVNITITGKEIDDAKNLIFTHKGIRGEAFKNEKGAVQSGKYKVQIAKDVPPGLYEAQLTGGRFGASNVATFVVGALPSVIAPDNNDSMEKAFGIDQNYTITGKTAARKYSYFKFSAQKGQKLLIHCATEEIDSSLSPVVNVLNHQGHELASESRAGLLDFTPSADGEYYIQLFDFLYGGSELHYFQLTISERPHIDFIEPPVGKPGFKAKYTLYGRNLPGGQPSELKLPNGRVLDKLAVEIQLPSNAEEKDPSKLHGKVSPREMMLSAIQYRLNSPKGPSNTVLIALSNEHLVTETNKSNDQPSNAQSIKVPCEFVGKFFPYADKDYLQFDAKKGDTFWIEGFSERFGRPSNLFFLIEQVTKNDKGEEQVRTIKEVLENPAKAADVAFKTTTNDPIFRFVAPADATFRILAYDLFNSGTPDIRNQYRISIRKESPSFTLAAYVKSPPPPDNNSGPVAVWPASIRKGELLPVKIVAQRRDNFDAPIQLDIQGLPSSISWAPRTIPAKQNSVTVLLHAGTDAKSWAGQIQITGKAKVGDKSITRNCLPATVIRASYDKQAKTSLVQTRLMKALALDLNDHEQSPVTIRPKEDKVWETSLHGILKVPFSISQSDVGFKQNRKIKLRGHPDASKVKEVSLDTKKDDGQIELNLAQFKLPVGEHPLYLATTIKGKYKRESDEAKKAADDAVKKADEDAKKAIAEAKKAESEYNGIKDKKDATQDQKNKMRLAMDTAKKKSSEAEAAKKKAQDYAKKVTEHNKPRDVNETFYSPPFVVRVTEAPIKFTSMQEIQLKTGEEIQWKVAIERLYEYKDAVTLNLALPGNLKGVTLKKANIDKDKTEAQIGFKASDKATPGEFLAKLDASLRINGQTIKLSEEVKVKVQAAPTEQAGS